MADKNKKMEEELK